jgi:ADP-heptose:LPS heptosyltransferase
VLTGGAHEAQLIDEIREASGIPVHSLAGELALGEMGAALRLATVVVSNNTGPAHIAAAVGTPLVDLYALTNPQHTPWQVRHRVLYHDVPCRFCQKSVCPQGHNDCLAKIAPSRVVDAVCDLLELDADAPVPATAPILAPQWAPLVPALPVSQP